MAPTPHRRRKPGPKPKGQVPEGVHVIRRALASGVRVEYHYAWRGGPAIKGIPGSSEYLISLGQLRAATKKRASDEPETLNDLIIAYKSSGEYARLGKDSKRAYEAYWPKIIAKFGDLEIEALENKRVRRHFIKWRDTMMATPRTADYAVGTLKRVLSWAKEAAYLDTNQAEPIGRLHSVDKSDSIVHKETIDAFMAVASQEVQDAVWVALYTGLRESNVVKLAWPNYDGSSIAYKTTKRKKDVLIPLVHAARARINQIPKRAVTLLTNTRGKPWTPDGLRTMLDKTCKKAGVKFTFHDLRRTACTVLLIHDMKVSQVSMIMGWSEADVEAMKRKYVSRKKIVEEMLAMLGEAV